MSRTLALSMDVGCTKFLLAQDVTVGKMALAATFSRRTDRTAFESIVIYTCLLVLWYWWYW